MLGSAETASRTRTLHQNRTGAGGMLQLRCQEGSRDYQLVRLWDGVRIRHEEVQLHRPTQDVYEHHPCRRIAGEGTVKLSNSVESPDSAASSWFRPNKPNEARG